MESMYEFSEDYDLLFDLVASGKEVIATIVSEIGIRRICLVKGSHYISFAVQGIEYAQSPNDKTVFAERCKNFGVKFLPLTADRKINVYV